MTNIIMEFLAGLFTMILFLIIAFYVYPRMKQEYKQKRWTWKTIIRHAAMTTDGRIVSYFYIF